MGKVLAIVFLIVFVWWAYPFVSRGVWITPTVVMPDSWMGDYVRANNADYLATPPSGYGWFHFDFWNDPTPYGTTVYQEDFRLKW